MDDVSLLKQHLDAARSAILWKLEGLEEWQIRWPLTPTGTNLLGVVKHLTIIESRFLGHPAGTSQEAGSEGPHRDMWATADESVEDVVRSYRHAVAQSDVVIAELERPAADQAVPARSVSIADPARTAMEGVLNVLTETLRHCGQIDILRERLDGRVGLRHNAPHLPMSDDMYWLDHVETVREAAMQAAWPGVRLGALGSARLDADAALAAVLRGEKRATSALLESYRKTGEALPVAGERAVLLTSHGQPATIVEIDDVRVVAFDEVDLDHALSEGEGYADVAQWRAAHVQAWSSSEMRAEVDDPRFAPSDETPVVLQRLHVVRPL